MSYSAMELRAERSILSAMGLAAVFTTYGGATYNLQVLPVDEHSQNRTGDFTTRSRDSVFETIAEDMPSDWRDGSLTVSGKIYNVLDVTLDEYGQRVRIKAE